MEKTRNALISIFFSLLLASPCIIWVLQDGLGLPLPNWLTAESAQYLSGGIEKADIRKHLSLEGFQTEKLQSSLDIAIENNIPLKSTVLLANSALQRQAITLSNNATLFNVYPTYYGSTTLYVPQCHALTEYPSTQMERYLEKSRISGEGIAKIARLNPDKNFYIVLADRSLSSKANPAHELVTGAVSTEDCLNAIEDGIADSQNVHVICVPYNDAEEYYDNYYRTDHHWNGYGTIQAYNAIEKVAELPHKNPDSTETIDFGSFRTNGSYAREGLMLLNEDVHEPKFDLSGLEILNKKKPPVVLKDGIRVLLNEKDMAEFSFYTEWYGDSFRTSKSPIDNFEAPSDKNALVIMDSYADSLHFLLAKNYSFLKCYRDIRAGKKGDERLIDRISEAKDADDIFFVGGVAAYVRLPESFPYYFDTE